MNKLFAFWISILTIASVSSVSADVKTYTNYDTFIQAEWQTCGIATDGCNNVVIKDWEFWASTFMRCFEIPVYSCVQKAWVEKTYSTSTEFLEAEWQTCEVATDWCNSMSIKDNMFSGGSNDYCSSYDMEYSCIKRVDWYEPVISEEEDVVIEDVAKEDEDNVVEDVISDTTWEDAIMCTMEYAPVCWIDWTTYSNNCMAWKIEVAYTNECNSMIDWSLYLSLKNSTSFNNKIDNILSKLSTEKLEEVLEKITILMETTKNSNISEEKKIRMSTAIMFLEVKTNSEITSR